MAIIFVISPQTFRGWSLDMVRTDILVVGFIAWAALVTMAGRRGLGLILILVGFLAHETALIFGFPLLLALNAHSYVSGQLDKRSAIKITTWFFVCLIVAVLATAILSKPGNVIAHHMLQAAPAADYEGKLARDVAIYMMVSGVRGLRTAICFNFQDNPQYYLTNLFCLGVLTSYVFILPIRTNPLATLVAVFIPVAFMMIVGDDTGRWLKMGVANAWLLSAFYQLRSKEGISFPAMITGSILFSVLIAMGPTTVNYVNPFTHRISNHLGVQELPNMSDWMNYCDPVWRRVAE